MAIFLLAGCIPERDNPYDPGSEYIPRAEVFEPYGFTCRQWAEPETYTLPPGFDPETDLSPEEFTEVDDFCYPRCAFKVVGEGTCDYSYVLTSVLSDETPPACTFADRTIRLDYAEALYLQDQRVVNLVVPARGELHVESAAEGGFHVLDPDFVSYELAYGSGRALVTTQAAEAFQGMKLLTRALETVERNQATLTFPAGRGSNQIECRVDIYYDQAHDVLSHPQGFGGGYGRHVAIADLPLEDVEDASNHASRLEFATTYAGASGRCWLDVAYRGADTRLTQISRETLGIDVEAECHPDGSPPPVAVGRFAGGDEAFAIQYEGNGVRWIDFVGAVGPYEVGAVGYFQLDGMTQAPVAMAGVGDLFSTSADEIALVPAGGESLLVCSPTGSCNTVDPPPCRGAGSRFVTVAPLPPEIPTDEVLTAVQSTAGTCVVRYAWTGSALEPVQQQEFTGIPDDVSVHWSTRLGEIAWLVAGVLDDSTPEVVVREFGPDPQIYDLFFAVDSCDPILTGTEMGVGVSAASLPDYECATDGSGCDLYSYRRIGLPTADVYHTLGGTDGYTIVDEGALGLWQDGECGSGYYAQGLFIEGLTASSVGASMAGRADPRRSRQPTSAVCEVPPTFLFGAPSESPLGGTGRMIVIYESGGTTRETPFCDPLGLP